MKLATLNSHGRGGKTRRDGKLVVVNKALTQYVDVPTIALTLQAALDDWKLLAPSLEGVYQRLNQGDEKNSKAFMPNQCLAPLPRAYQWLDSTAYLHYLELVHKVRGSVLPETFWTTPYMYQGGSDRLVGAHATIEIIEENAGVDFESEIAIITDDVPMHVSLEQAPHHIRLIALANDVTLRNLIPNELAKGYGFVHSKPSTSFAPVVVTPDELGDAWRDNKVNLSLVTTYNDKLFGRPNAGADMSFDFSQLIEHAAKTRQLTAGTIIGSGTVSNQDSSVGSSCIVERRMLEILARGYAITEFMKFGDHVRIEMFSDEGESIFGAINQYVIEHAVSEEEVRYTSAFE
ncbi:fumarylacetoacetate hydrolase family protein [Kiloniella antarctica]|uniref:Fumarylacetoacetate hydrolase family protein n=1 Tax=Kiloniella antarctica TaxID=1550907 RepID=A0ABW5BRT1_9PROT